MTDIQIKRLALMVGNNNIERTSSIKFLGVMLDEHISWIDHVRTVENKIAKNIGLLYRVSQFLNEDSLKTVYFSYIHSYLNYANIAWANNTYATKLKRPVYNVHPSLSIRPFVQLWHFFYILLNDLVALYFTYN